MRGKIRPISGSVGREGEQPVRLRMVRWNLEKLPAFAFPPGYSVRWYQPGDDQYWCRIHLQADCLNQISHTLFAEQFGTDRQTLRERQCYLVAPDAEIVGTATAWFNNDFLGKSFGRVHWVALTPQYQGRGLSRPLLSVICETLRNLGHTRAYLSTSPERIPAIRTYRLFGFQPLVENEQDAELWRKLEPILCRNSTTSE
jgi:GNAT superfamily N-acetyltransferase